MQINWNLVGNDLGIANGHVARMRYSRFKKQMQEGTSGILKTKNLSHNKPPAKTPRKISAIDRTPWEDIQRRIKQEDAELNAVHFDQENWVPDTGNSDEDVAGSQVPIFALSQSSSTKSSDNSNDTRRSIEDETPPNIGDTNGISGNEGMNACNDNLPAESQIPEHGDPQSSPPKPTVQLNETGASTEHQQNIPDQIKLSRESDVGQTSEQDCTQHNVLHVNESGGSGSPSSATEASSNLRYANTVAANSSIETQFYLLPRDSFVLLILAGAFFPV